MSQQPTQLKNVKKLKNYVVEQNKRVSNPYKQSKEETILSS